MAPVSRLFLEINYSRLSPVRSLLVDLVIVTVVLIVIIVTIVVVIVTIVVIIFRFQAKLFEHAS